MTACPKCHHLHVAGDVVALSRFAGISGYRTRDGAVYETRDNAQAAICEQRQADQ